MQKGNSLSCRAARTFGAPTNPCACFSQSVNLHLRFSLNTGNLVPQVHVAKIVIAGMSKVNSLGTMPHTT
jgi:hypothetical protein